MQNRRLSVLMSRWELLAGLCFLPLYLLLLSALLQVLLQNILGRPPEMTELNALFYTICFVAVLLIFHRFLWQNCPGFLANKGKILRAMPAALLLYFGLTFLIGFFVTALQPDFVNQNNDAVFGMLKDSPTFVFLLSVILAPVIEETIFRGLVFSNLQRFNRPLAYALTALFFAFIHVSGYTAILTPLEVFLSILQYLPATFVLCAMYERSNTIYAPILLHAAINLINCVVMLVVY